MSTDDELYAQFVDAYLEAGSDDIPKSWSDDLKERCRLFLKLTSTLKSSSSVSILATLGTLGVRADVTLTDVGSAHPSRTAPTAAASTSTVVRVARRTTPATDKLRRGRCSSSPTATYRPPSVITSKVPFGSSSSALGVPR